MWRFVYKLCFKEGFVTKGVVVCCKGDDVVFRSFMLGRRLMNGVDTLVTPISKSDDIEHVSGTRKSIERTTIQIIKFIVTLTYLWFSVSGQRTWNGKRAPCSEHLLTNASNLYYM